MSALLAAAEQYAAGLAVLAVITVAVVYRWVSDRDVRRRGELPKAADYVPPSNVGRVWPDADAWVKEQAEMDLPGGLQ